MRMKGQMRRRCARGHLLPHPRAMMYRPSMVEMAQRFGEKPPPHTPHLHSLPHSPDRCGQRSYRSFSFARHHGKASTHATASWSAPVLWSFEGDAPWPESNGTCIQLPKPPRKRLRTAALQDATATGTHMSTPPWRRSLVAFLRSDAAHENAKAQLQPTRPTFHSQPPATGKTSMHAVASWSASSPLALCE